MSNYRGIPIEFILNGVKVVPLNKKERYKNRHYLTYETNIPQFFIKIFKYKDIDINELYKKSCVAMTTELDKSDLSPVKILTTIQNQNPIFWGLLIDSYSLDFKEMIGLSSHAYDFDIFKFALQIGCYLKEFKDRDIPLLHLTEDNIVMDSSGNFQMVNLDHSHLIFKKGGEKGQEYIDEYINAMQTKKKDSPMAPEIVSNQEFGIEALIWDFGILLMKIFIGIYPKVDYSRKKVLLNFENKKELNESRKAIISLIKSCLKFRKSERISQSDIMKNCIAALSPISKLLFSIKTKLININSPSILRTSDNIGNMVSIKKFRNDKALENLIVKNKQKNYSDLPIKSKIKMILMTSYRMVDEVIREIIRMAWNEPNTIVEVYLFIKEKLDSILNSEIKTMKLLLFFFAYISKGSQNILKVNDKTDNNSKNKYSSNKSYSSKNSSSTGSNAVIFFLEKIFELYENNSQNLIYKFNYFVLIKFNLHMNLSLIHI